MGVEIIKTGVIFSGIEKNMGLPIIRLFPFIGRFVGRFFEFFPARLSRRWVVPQFAAREAFPAPFNPLQEGEHQPHGPEQHRQAKHPQGQAKDPGNGQVVAAVILVPLVNISTGTIAGYLHIG